MSTTLAAAAPPSGRVAIMNANSGLCLSPAGGGRDRKKIPVGECVIARLFAKPGAVRERMEYHK